MDEWQQEDPFPRAGWNTLHGEIARHGGVEGATIVLMSEIADQLKGDK